MWYQNSKFWKIVAACTIFLMVLLGTYYVYKYLTQGSISVSTNDPSNYVKVQWSVGANKTDGSFSKQAQHQLSTRVSPGAYQISVYGKHDLSGISQTVNVRSKQHLRIALNPPTALTPEPVYGSSVNSVFSNNSLLMFNALSLGQPDGKIMQADTAGKLSTLFSGAYFTEVKWANANLGVGVSKSNSVLLLQNGAATPLHLPFAVSNRDKLSVDISSDGKIYLSNGKSVYVSDSGGSFRILYSTDNEHPVSMLAAGQNKVAIVMNQVEALESKRTGNKSTGVIAVVGVNGNKVVRPADISSATWSPDKKQIVATTSLSGVIYDSSLTQIGSISTNNASNFIWATNGSIVYSVDNQLWSYNVNSRISKRVAQLSLGNNVIAIYPSTNGNDIYFASDNGSREQLSVVGEQEKPSDKLEKLGVILPEDVGICSLNYVNFNATTVLVSYPDHETSPQLCIDKARQELSSFGLDSSGFNFSVNTN